VRRPSAGKAPRLKQPKVHYGKMPKPHGAIPAGPRSPKMPNGPQARPHEMVNMRGKGSTEEHLPSRHMMSSITGGDQVQRSLNQYAKGTPLDVGAETSPNIFGIKG